MEDFQRAEILNVSLLTFYQHFIYIYMCVCVCVCICICMYVHTNISFYFFRLRDYRFHN